MIQQILFFGKYFADYILRGKTMIYGGILFALILMAVMVNLAVSKKSNSQTRIAAVIALAVMVLSVIICLFIAFTDTTVALDPSRLIVGEPPETKKEGGNSYVLILLVVFLIAIFVIVAILATKENRKHLNDTKSKPISNW